VAPETATEQALAEIWALLLKRDRVGVHDNFFDLGGHSLLAMQVSAQTSARFGVGLPLSALFETRTVARLAQRIDESLWLLKQSAVPAGASEPLQHYISEEI
jgi:acyl carrier protein